MHCLHVVIYFINVFTLLGTFETALVCCCYCYYYYYYYYYYYKTRLFSLLPDGGGTREDEDRIVLSLAEGKSQIHHEIQFQVFYKSLTTITTT